MVDEAKKGQLWANDDFIRVKCMAEGNADRLNQLKALRDFWVEKQDALKRLIIKKNLPFK